MADVDLGNAAQALLAACVTLLGDACPKRAFVAPSTPYPDTQDFLAVNCDGITLPVPSRTTPGGVAGWGAGQLQEMGVVPVCAFTVTIMRAAPRIATQGRQRVSDLADVSMRTSQDAWILINGLLQLIRAEVLLVNIPVSEVGASSVMSETGDAVGWMIALNASIDGYDPA